MSDEELIKETMMLDYSQLVMNNVYCHKEIERLENIIKEVREYMEKTIQDDGEYLGYKSMYSEDYYKILEILSKGE